MGPARILVVEDSTADVSLLRVALNQQNQPYELEVLQTADEALAFVQEHRQRLHSGHDGRLPDPDPCVILLDLHLPRYDGLTILKAIKQAPVLSHIHVMVLSGLATPQEQFKIATLGAFYREKPSSLDGYLELGAEIFAVCADSGKAAAA
jgi:two-component system, chemotaxis family, response regulator Rcp1